MCYPRLSSAGNTLLWSKRAGRGEVYKVAAEPSVSYDLNALAVIGGTQKIRNLEKILCCISIAYSEDKTKSTYHLNALFEAVVKNMRIGPQQKYAIAFKCVTEHMSELLCTSSALTCIFR